MAVRLQQHIPIGVHSMPHHDRSFDAVPVCVELGLGGVFSTLRRVRLLFEVREVRTRHGLRPQLRFEKLTRELAGAPARVRGVYLIVARATWPTWGAK